MGVGMRSSDFTLPILLLAMEVSSDMGGSLRKRARPMSRSDGHGVSRAEAAPVHRYSLGIHDFLVATFLFLAAFLLRPVAQLEGIPIVGVRFGKNIPWVTQFLFGVIKDPQYVGSILSLGAR
ncbi:uncharacterized protein LOC116006088 isoform X2 [Ipomoea triloba]|nr:uncharacterized protein LOC116006088 isoform X2 [Ipomoea triloba]